MFWLRFNLPDPLALMVQTSPSFTKAIVRPSGDHTGA
jgi:hypothetical protein